MLPDLRFSNVNKTGNTVVTDIFIVVVVIWLFIWHLIYRFLYFISRKLAQFWFILNYSTPLVYDTWWHDLNLFLWRCPESSRKSWIQKHFGSPAQGFCQRSEKTYQIWRKAKKTRKTQNYWRTSQVVSGKSIFICFIYFHFHYNHQI